MSSPARPSDDLLKKMRKVEDAMFGPPEELDPEEEDATQPVKGVLKRVCRLACAAFAWPRMATHAVAL